MPCSLSTSCAGGYIGLPIPPQISSVLVAAEAISNLYSVPSFSTMSLRTNSEMGERHIFPWQTKSIFIIVLFLLDLSRNALPRLSSRSRQSQNARLCKHIGTLRSLLRVFCKGFWDSCSLL